MGSGAERSSDSAFWKELYEAALFEFDSQQLPERIAVAEKAVTERRRELTENGGDRQEEQEALPSPADPSRARAVKPGVASMISRPAPRAGFIDG